MIGIPNALIRYLTEQDPDQQFEVKIHRERRSLNANNYAWALISKIADIMNMSKDETYRAMLKDYGQSEMITLVKGIQISGYIKYYEKAGETIINGQEAEHYLVFKGSSEMDTKEMSILLDGIVQEAKSLGIETLDDAEIKRLEEGWK